MIHTALLAAYSALSVAAGSDCPPAARPDAHTAYVALLAEFPDRPGAFINKHEARGRDAAAKFFAFAREHRQAPEAAEALGWVATHCLYSAEAAEAMRWIAKEYAGSPGLAGTMADLDRMYGGPFEAKEEMLRAVAKGSPHREVRGAAALGVARELSLKRAKDRRDRAQHALFMGGGAVPFVAEPKATEAEVRRWAAEAVTMCESITSDEAYSEGLRSDAEALVRSIREPAPSRREPK